MKPYMDLVSKILRDGEIRSDRTGVGTRSVFGWQMRFDLREGFPLLTAKATHFRSVAEELFWFLSGSTNVKPLQAKGVSIWDEWADANGELGRIYGAQWRGWQCPDGRRLDQIGRLIEEIKSNPQSRRHLVVAFNPGEISKMALPPCHSFFQCYVGGDGSLSLQMYQRSADVFLGLPFNIASYALLLMLLARETGLLPKELILTVGDAHIYSNAIAQSEEMLRRDERALPKLTFAPSAEGKGIFEIGYEDLVLKGYTPHPRIKADVAV